MEGMLYKRSDGKDSQSAVGKAMAHWNRRWFVCDPKEKILAYYKDPSLLSEKGMAGFVELQGCEVRRVIAEAPRAPSGSALARLYSPRSERHNYVFSVITDARVLTLSASDETELEQWVTAINGVRAQSVATSTARTDAEATAAAPAPSSASTSPPATNGAATSSTRAGAANEPHGVPKCVASSSEGSKQSAPSRGVPRVVGAGLGSPGRAPGRPGGSSTTRHGSRMATVHYGPAAVAAPSASCTVAASAGGRAAAGMGTHPRAFAALDALSTHRPAAVSIAFPASPIGGGTRVPLAGRALAGGAIGGAGHAGAALRQRMGTPSRLSFVPISEEGGAATSGGASTPMEAWASSLQALGKTLSPSAPRYDASEARAAARLQLRLSALWRGRCERRQLLHAIQYNYASGDLIEAQRHANSRLAKTADGEPIALDCESEEFATLGQEVHAYMAFVQRATLAFASCGLLALSLTFANFEGGDMGEDLNPYNALSLGNVARLKLSNAAIEVVISGVLVAFLYRARARHLRDADAARQREISPADFSVQVDGLHDDTPDAGAVVRLLEGAGAPMDHLVSLTLSVDARDLIALERTRAEAKRAENMVLARCYMLRRQFRERRTEVEGGLVSHPQPPPRRRQQQQQQQQQQQASQASRRARNGERGAPPAPPVARSVADIHADLMAARLELRVASAAVRGTDGQRDVLLAAGHQCTGTAFATFNTEHAAEQCIAALTARARERPPRGATLSEEDLRTRRLTARRPPEPEAVHWDELQFGRGARLAKQLLTNGAILLVALVGTTCIAAANYGMGPVLRAAGDRTVLVQVGMQVGFTLMIILGNIFIFILSPLLAEKVEHHHTFDARQRSAFLKMYLFQVFNTVVASAVFYFWPAEGRHPWYAYGVACVTNVLLGDLFVISVFLDALQPGVLLARLLHAPKASCQREMNARYSCPAHIYVAFRLQLVAKFITITLLFASALPYAYLICAAFLYLGQWIDRVNLLRRLEPPPRSADALISLLLRAILPAAIAVHLLGALMFYVRELELAEADPRCAEAATATATVAIAAAAAAATVASTAATAAEAAAAAVAGGGGAGELHSAVGRCQTDASLLEARYATYAIAGSAAVWGAFLLRFAVRECRRRVEKGLHVLTTAEGHSAVAQFLELGFADDRESRLLHDDGPPQRARRASASNQRPRLYLPPLPKSVLRRLRTASQQVAAAIDASGVPPPPGPRAGKLDLV